MPPIHVALNAAFLDPGVSGGPESYMRGLIEGLARARPDAQLSVLTSRRGAEGLRASGWQSFATLVALPTDEGQRGRRLAAELVGVPLWVARNRPTVVHSLASIGPVRPMAAPHVLTLHDLTFLRIDTFGKATTVAMSRIALGAARHAARIITATRASLDEIVTLGGVDRSRVDVVPHGRRSVLEPSDDAIAAMRETFSLGGKRVVVNVAAKRPHKNQELLIRALPHLPADVVLVLAGHEEPYADQLRALAPELGVADRVHLPHYLGDEELEALWRVADAAAFPTRGEGFGLPVIEALDRGLPVACSDIPVLTEVSGGLAHPFPVDDPEAAAAAVTAALADDPDDPARHAYASQFTWDRAAELTWDSYDRAIAAGKTR